MLREVVALNWKMVVHKHQSSYDYQALRPVIDEMRERPRGPHYVKNFIQRTEHAFPERTVRRWYSNALSDPNWYPGYNSHQYHRRALGDVNEQLIDTQIDDLTDTGVVVPLIKVQQLGMQQYLFMEKKYKALQCGKTLEKIL